MGVSRVAAFDDVDFYTDPSVVDDPYPYFARLREKGPVVALPHHGVVAVTTHETTVEVDRNHEQFSSCNSVTGPFPGFSVEPEGDDINDFIAQHRDELPMSEYVITQDPPTHQAHRGLVMRLLTPRRMRENEEFMWGLADRQIDELLETGRCEVLRQYGQPFALLVIADLLGVPEEDHREFRRHLGGLPAPAAEGEDLEVVHDPLSFLVTRFTEYVEDRRREPRADVLTQLATATYPDGGIPEVDVVVRMATFLFAAGQDTTARLITNSLRIIAEDRAVQDYLRADSERIPNFVEEVLRFESVVKSRSRVARVTTSVAGVEIPAGTTVAMFPGAANRDPERFEAPDEFRPDRSNANDHLSFGRGVHSCPGGPLSRIEAKVSIERFLARTSDIRIDEAEHGPPEARRWEYEPTYIIRGLKRLHLEITPSDRDG
jgi:cytochrome P450